MPSVLEVVLLVCSLAAGVLGEESTLAGYRPVNVTLFYETLCPDCQQFIPDQLYSTYTDTNFDFASLIANLTLVPYGWVQVIDPVKHKYHCQHHKSECDGNRLQGCAIKYITDTRALLTYINCLEESSVKHTSRHAKYPINKCQDKVPEGLYPKIMECYNGEESWELFQINGNITNNFFSNKGSSFVPYVSFNNKKDDTLAEIAAEDFRKALCSVAGVKDKACTDNNIP